MLSLILFLRICNYSCVIYLFFKERSFTVGGLVHGCVSELLFSSLDIIVFNKSIKMSS